MRIGGSIKRFVKDWRQHGQRWARRAAQGWAAQPYRGLLAVAALQLLWLLPCHFLPLGIYATGGWRGIFVRFHLSAEILLLLVLLYLAQRAGYACLGRIGAWLLYALALAHEVYDIFIRATFHREPALYNDLFLLPDALNLTLDLASAWGEAWVGLLIVLGGLAVGLGVWWGLGAVAGLVARWRWRSFLGATAVMVLLLGVLHWERGLSARDSAVQSSFGRLADNLIVSAAMERAVRAAGAAADAGPDWRAELDRVQLQTRPGILLVVVESYGSIALQHPALAAPFQRTLATLEARLRHAGWLMASHLSDAPVSGGTSWLSTASLLGGVQLSSQPLYHRFISAMPMAMPAFFAAQGYHTATIQPANRDRPGRPLANPYGFDQTIFWQELAYEGRGYGWGVVPDQYSLHKGWTLLARQRPSFVFFMTVSSHAPWSDTPPLLTDWQSLSDPSNQRSFWQLLAAKLGLAHQAQPERPGDFSSDAYLTALSYELALLGDFLTQDVAGSVEIVILLGDHQPPYFDTSGDLSTPVHVISRDPRFLTTLATYGFTPGLAVAPAATDTRPRLRHAGLFSLLVRSLAQVYGRDAAHLPAYHLSGLPLSALVDRR